MTTIVNTPPAESSGGGSGVLIAVAIVILLLALAFFFGRPFLARMTTVPSVSVPDKIDVNVNTE
jgi:hypothetical protein